MKGLPLVARGGKNSDDDDDCVKSRPLEGASENCVKSSPLEGASDVCNSDEDAAFGLRGGEQALFECCQ